MASKYPTKSPCAYSNKGDRGFIKLFSPSSYTAYGGNKYSSRETVLEPGHFYFLMLKPRIICPASFHSYWLFEIFRDSIDEEWNSHLQKPAPILWTKMSKRRLLVQASVPGKQIWTTANWGTGEIPLKKVLTWHMIFQDFSGWDYQTWSRWKMYIETLTWTLLQQPCNCILVTYI